MIFIDHLMIKGELTVDEYLDEMFSNLYKVSNHFENPWLATADSYDDDEDDDDDDWDDDDDDDEEDDDEDDWNEEDEDEK